MKNLRKDTILLATDRGVLTLTYTLSLDEDGSYAIALLNRTTGESAVLCDLTPNWDKARGLYDLLVRGGVTVVTFRDVVEDVLAAG